MKINKLIINFVAYKERDSVKGTHLKIGIMAYEKKIPVDLNCPLRLTMSLIESKWKSCILDELRDGNPLRPSEIHKCLPEAAPRVLDIQLKEMVEDGLVQKTIYPELPPRSEYTISALGLSLIPIIDQMLKWGELHIDIFEKKIWEREKMLDIAGLDVSAD